jgi:hypothetical protein
MRISASGDCNHALRQSFGAFAVQIGLTTSGSGDDHSATSSEGGDNSHGGEQVDVAVRDTDAYIFRLGYNITLLGRIVPTKVIIL